MKQTINIIGGSTFNHIRNHLSLAIPAFGTTARKIKSLVIYDSRFNELEIKIY